jgi:hypothetical protein
MTIPNPGLCATFGLPANQTAIWRRQFLTNAPTTSSLSPLVSKQDDVHILISAFAELRCNSGSGNQGLVNILAVAVNKAAFDPLERELLPPCGRDPNGNWIDDCDQLLVDADHRITCWCSA